MKKKKKTILNQYRRRTPAMDVIHRFRKNIGAMIGLCFLLILTFIAVFSNVLFDYENQVIHQNFEERMQPPSLKHPFGTDNLGRDQFIRLLYGTRYSLPIGAVSVLLGLTFGMVLGSIAGYFGGKVDNVIMRFLDIFATIPSFLLAMCLIVAFGGSGILPLMLALGIGSITGFARITRASILSSKNHEYVEAAKAIGASNLEIIFKQVLPNSLSPIIVQATLKMGSEIILASSLSYLGLGVQPPTPEWGALLSAGRAYVRNASYLTLFPGLLIMLTVIAFNMVGDGLRDAMDPKLKK